MKRMILLAMMLVPFLCSAQEKEGLYRVDEDGNEIKIEMRGFDYMSSTKLEFSTKGNDSSKTLLSSKLSFYLYGKKSENRFKREITFRVYFDSESTHTIDDYYVGAFDFEKRSRYISQDQDPEADHPFPMASYKPDPQSRVWPISDNVYEINVSAEKGEFYILLIDQETREYVGVYDFRLK